MTSLLIMAIMGLITFFLIIYLTKLSEEDYYKQVEKNKKQNEKNKLARHLK